MPSDTLEDDQSLEELGEELEGELITDGGRDVEEYRARVEEGLDNTKSKLSEKKDKVTDSPLTYTAASLGSAGGLYAISDEVVESAHQLPEAISQTAAYSANVAAGAALGALALGTGAKAVQKYREEDN